MSEDGVGGDGSCHRGVGGVTVVRITRDTPTYTPHTHLHSTYTYPPLTTKVGVGPHRPEVTSGDITRALVAGAPAIAHNARGRARA